MMRFQLVVGAVMVGLIGTLAACSSDTGQGDEADLSAPEVVAASAAALSVRRLPNNLPFLNADGFAATYSTTGSVDLTGPFFQSLGTNGRSCASCHLPDQGWTITPAGVQARFNATGGTDPVFRLNDGSNSPTADVSTVAKRRKAYSMLLTKALIRVSNPVPATADYSLVAVDDPYGHASAADISTFRRPLPTANLDAVSTVMWDGRESQTTVATDPDLMGCTLPPTAPKCFKSLQTDLMTQSNDATLGHAQAMLGLIPAQQASIVAFERALFFGQVYDWDAKLLTDRGATGGPVNISLQTFYFGQNDVLSGDYRTHAPFTTKVFDEYDAWANLGAEQEHDGDHDCDADDHHHGSRTERARRSVARGQELFNSKPISITGVKGINDDFAVPVFPGTCTTCHDTPHGGNHSIPAPLDIGLTGDHPEALARTADLPFYTFRQNSDGQIFKTTDPGRGLITGKFKDLGRFKGPVLRGVAARAPYFHNGSAATLEDAVTFYNKRFAIGLTAREQRDIAAFLKTL
jgi:cytochrome c peroxidase